MAQQAHARMGMQNKTTDANRYSFGCELSAVLHAQAWPGAMTCIVTYANMHMHDMQLAYDANTGKQMRWSPGLWHLATEPLRILRCAAVFLANCRYIPRDDPCYREPLSTEHNVMHVLVRSLPMSSAPTYRGLW